MYQTFRQIQQYFNICFWYLWSKRVPCAHFLLPATCRIHVNMQYWESTPQRCSSPGSEIPEDKGSVQPTCLRVENEESRNSHPASPWSSNRLAPIHLRRFRPYTTARTLCPSKNRLPVWPLSVVAIGHGSNFFSSSSLHRIVRWNVFTRMTYSIMLLKAID
jgi:hypothetical protein